MPQTVDIPQTPQPPSLQEMEFKFGGIDLGDAEDIHLVTTTFLEYESRRYMHEQRWRNCDGLYNGAVPVRKWEGSDAIRSAIPNNIAFDHVEATQAKLEEAFLDNPEWFHVEPTADSSPEDARDIGDYLSMRLNTPGPGLSHGPLLQEARTSWHQLSQYGNGALLVEWDDGPYAKFIDIRDIYIDPLCPSPNIQEARSIIIRKWMTIEEVAKLRENPRFKIPDNSILWTLSQSRFYVSADQAKQTVEALRGVYNTNQSNDNQPDIHLNQIELLCYYTKTRIVWLLGRRYPIYKAKNDLGYYPIAMAPCRLVPGHVYGISLPESVQWNQRYSEALMNNMVDDLYLRQDPPMVIGKDVDSTQTKMRPGNRIPAMDPKTVVGINNLGTPVTDVFPVVDWLERGAGKRNGISDLAASGVAGAPGNVRTGTGVNAQMAGSNLRIKHIVHNIEDFQLSQVLYIAYHMVGMYTRPDDVLAGRFSDPNTGRVITARAFHKPARFIMLAGTRMMQRLEAKELVPFIGQAFINGAVMQGLADMGETFNFRGFADMVQLVVGRSIKLVVPLSEEQKKARKEPPPQLIAEQQKAQADASVRMAMAEKANEREQIKGQFALQAEQIKKQPDFGQSLLAQQELRARQQEHQINISAKAQDAQLKTQIAAQKAQTDAAMQRQKLAFEYEKMQQERQRMAMEHENQIRQMMLNAAMTQQQAAMPQQPKPTTGNQENNAS